MPSRTQLYAASNTSLLLGEAGSKPLAYLRLVDKYGNVHHSLPAGTSLSVLVGRAGVAGSLRVVLELSTEQLQEYFDPEQLGFRWGRAGPPG